MARRLLVTFAALAPLLTVMAFVVSPACAFRDVGAQESHHLHFYMHDFAAGHNASAICVAHGAGPLIPGSTDRRFGDVLVMDDALTEGPGPASRALGRAQGFYVAASSTGGSGDGGSDPAMLISMNVLLTSGLYNESTLTITGRNAVLAPVRELSVVGGTGKFRMATGYVLLKTVNWHDDDALLELDVYVNA